MIINYLLYLRRKIYKKNNLRYQLLFAIILSTSLNTNAQLNSTTIGDAVDLGENCFRITEDKTFQKGGVWYDNPIDFAHDFTIRYQSNFGGNDANGADGIAIVFKGVFGKSDAVCAICIYANSIVLKNIMF